MRPRRLTLLAACAIVLVAVAAVAASPCADALAAMRTRKTGPAAALMRPAPGPVVGPRAIIVLVDQVGYGEVAGGEYPGFAALSDRGSVALSTIPLGTGGKNGSAYATIGNGAPISTRAVRSELSNGFNATETVDATAAVVAYARNTGEPTTARVVNPDIVAFSDAFTRGGGGRAAGGLANSLRAAGLSAALLGNADGSEPDSLDRSAMLVAMDASGTVAAGDVGSSLVVTDLAAPLGVRTDFTRLEELLRSALPSSTLVVAETGDLQRARVEGPLATSDAAAAAHRDALRRTDAFLQRIIGLANKDTLIVVASTSVPASDTAAGRSLAPVWLVGGGFPAGGILSSATTRRTGVIALHDIAPTVLLHLDVKRAQPMIGLVLSGKEEPARREMLLTTLQRAGAQHSQRATAVAAFIFLQTLLFALLAIPWLQRRIVAGRWWWTLPYACGCAALAIVLAPALGSPELGTALTTVALIALACAVALAAIRDRVLALGVLATATAGVIAADLAAGAPLARWSFLGYDLVVGGRFYGVGNEYEGVLIGAAVVGSACLVAISGRHRRFAVAAVGLGCLAFIGMFALPRLGADAGGALAAAIGVGVTFYGFAGGRFTVKRVLVLAGVLLALGVAGIAIASLFGGTGNSHVGRFLARLARGDLGFAWTLVSGKLRANYHLFVTSPWRSVLVAAVAAIAVIGVRYRAVLHRAYGLAPDLARGIPGLIAGGVAVLLLNDSGVIALATLAPFAMLLLLTLISLALAEEPAP